MAHYNAASGSVPPERYRLGTFHMAGGNPAHGDRTATADALIQNVKDRGSDIVFLQEAYEDMTNRLRAKLPGYKVVFQPIPKTDPKPGKPDEAPYLLCKDEHTDEKTASEFGIGIGIGIVHRSSLTVTRQHLPYILPRLRFSTVPQTVSSHVRSPIRFSLLLPARL